MWVCLFVFLGVRVFISKIRMNSQVTMGSNGIVLLMHNKHFVVSGFLGDIRAAMPIPIPIPAMPIQD